MARYVDSGYRAPYGHAATPPTYDGYDRSYGSYSANGGVVGDGRRAPQGPAGNNYRRDEFDEYGQKSYPRPAAAPGYGSSGQSYRPGEYGGNKDRGKKDEFDYIAPRPGHGTGPLTTPTNDVGAAVEILKDSVTYSSASSGGYPRMHQAGTRYTETASTVYYYPEIMPHTMDPTKRYGNINLRSRRTAVAEDGRNYY